MRPPCEGIGSPKVIQDDPIDLKGREVTMRFPETRALLIFMVLAACSTPPSLTPPVSPASLPPAWTHTPAASQVSGTAPGQPTATLPFPESADSTATMVVATTTAPAFGGADQWWLRLPDASLVYASGTSDGGAVLLTRLRQAEALGPYTAIRLLPDGTPAWEVTLDGLEIPTGILETGDGGVLVVEGDQITKLDSYGTLLWTRSYPFGDSDSFTYTEELFGPIQDVRSNGDGTQVIGRVGSIVTLDQEGAPVEYHMAASLDNVITDDEWVSAAAPDSVYFGEWESDSVFRFGRRSTVGPSWESRFDFINFDITLLAPPEFIRPTLDGGALFIGLAPNLIADGGSAIWIARLGRSGNVMWQRIYDGVYEDDFYAIETSDGGFLIADTDTFFGRVYQGSFLRLTRFNSSGYILWDRR